MVLRGKYDAGLSHYKPINTDNLVMRLNAPAYHRIADMVSASAITILQNTDSILPIKHLDTQSFVFLSVGNAKGNAFGRALGKYAEDRSLNVMEAADTAFDSFAP